MRRRHQRECWRPSGRVVATNEAAAPTEVLAAKRKNSGAGRGRRDSSIGARRGERALETRERRRDAVLDPRLERRAWRQFWWRP
jgi:hypothetical protein